MTKTLTITNDKGSLILLNNRAWLPQTLTLYRVDTNVTDESLQSLLNEISKFKDELFSKGISRILIGPFESATVREEELITTTKKTIIEAQGGLMIIVEVDNL